MMTTTATLPSLKMIELCDRQDWPAVQELIAPNVFVRVGANTMDRDHWRGMGEMFYAAFPDAKHDVLAVHTAGEYTTVVSTFSGTHKGELMGLPATGRKVSFEVIHVDRVVNGRIVEHRGQFDTGSLMQQLTAPAFDPLKLSDELFALIDSQQFERARTLLTPTCEFRFGGMSMDPNGWQGFCQAWFAAFPDGHHVFDERIVAGDRMTGIGAFVGTHRGAFQGIAPTGRSIRLTFTGVMKFAGDKVSQMFVQVDSAGLMQQLTQS